MPNFDYEWGEANRYPEYRKLGKEEWIKLAKTGKVIDINNRMANDIENTEAGEEHRYDYWDGLVKDKRDRFTKALSSGQIELPIIARYSDGYLELVAGNTRLTGMMRELGKAKAWIYDVPDDVADLEENFADGKFDLRNHGTDVPLGKYLYHVTHAGALLGMLKDGHLNYQGTAPHYFADYFSMTSDPKYSVTSEPEVQIVIDTSRVSQMKTFEKYVDDWESTPGAGDWAKGAAGDHESEYRVEEIIPWDYVVAVKILKSKATPEIVELAKKRGVKLIGKENSVFENFADGKVKGKSRPGRVKKSGASCNGSVTALRKRAKNASGETAKMYHWCANMKGGKKK